MLLKNSLKRHFNLPYVALVASGHDALYLALSSLRLAPHDEIVLPANAYPTAFPTFQTGAKVLLVDVDENGQIHIKSLLKTISKKTKVVIVVHMYGLTTDVLLLQKICRVKNIILIEDCAQAFGGNFGKKPIGTFGDIACLSFYPTKNIGTLGDGGAVLTKHKRIFEWITKAASYGEKEKYQSLFVSGHSRLAEIQAGILNIYLSHSKKDFLMKKLLFEYYKKRLESKILIPSLRLLASHPKSDPVVHLCVVEAQKRDALRRFLAQRKIITYIHYPTPLHLLPAFSSLGKKKGDFVMSERLSKNIVSLPFDSHLSKKAIDSVVDTIEKFYTKQ